MFNHLIKVLVSILVIAVLVLPLINCYAVAEDKEPIIDYVIADSVGFHGHVFVQPGLAYFAKLVVFLPGNIYYIIEVPVDVDGSWSVNMFCKPEHVDVVIVDQPNAFNGTEYFVYDAIGIDF